jgi:hypothetical protein
VTSLWTLSHRYDKSVLPLANRHYNRQKPETPQFVPPGRCLVLKHGSPVDAFWVTSWQEYAMHAWQGAWLCSAFRSEQRAVTASALIHDAVAATRWRFGDAPELGMVTFLDRDHVRPTRVRGQSVYGWTWMRVGFEPDGQTKGGLLAFRLSPERMPEPKPPAQTQLDLWPFLMGDEP